MHLRTPIISVLLLAGLPACMPVRPENAIDVLSASSSPALSNGRILSTVILVSAIDAHIADMRKEVRHLYGQPTEGAELVAYWDSSHVAKLSGSYTGETWRSTTDVYFAPDDAAVFVRIHRDTYVAPLGVSSQPIVTTEVTEETSLRAGTPFEVRKDNIIVPPNSPDFVTLSRDAVREVTDLRADFERAGTESLQ
jgi:hypothetical protein